MFVGGNDYKYYAYMKNPLVVSWYKIYRLKKNYYIIFMCSDEGLENMNFISITWLMLTIFMKIHMGDLKFNYVLNKYLVTY